MLIALAETSEARSASRFFAELLDAGKALIEAQPSMASPEWSRRGGSYRRQRSRGF